MHPVPHPTNLNTTPIPAHSDLFLTLDRTSKPLPPPLHISNMSSRHPSTPPPDSPSAHPHPSIPPPSLPPSPPFPPTLSLPHSSTASLRDMSTPLVVAVLGADTLIGRHVLRHLLRSERVIQVHAICPTDPRDGLRVSNRLLRKLLMHIGPYDSRMETLLRWGIKHRLDVAFVCLSSSRSTFAKLGPFGYREFTYTWPRRFLDGLFERGGVRSMVVVTHPKATSAARGEYMKVKGEFIDWLQRRQKECGRFAPALVILRVALILTDLLEIDGSDEKVSVGEEVRQKAAIRFDVGPAKAVHFRDVARAMVVGGIDDGLRDEDESDLVYRFKRRQVRIIEWWGDDIVNIADEMRENERRGTSVHQEDDDLEVELGGFSRVPSHEDDDQDDYGGEPYERRKRVEYVAEMGHSEHVTSLEPDAYVARIGYPRSSADNLQTRMGVDGGNVESAEASVGLMKLALGRDVDEVEEESNRDNSPIDDGQPLAELQYIFDSRRTRDEESSNTMHLGISDLQLDQLLIAQGDTGEVEQGYSPEEMGHPANDAIADLEREVREEIANLRIHDMQFDVRNAMERREENDDYRAEYAHLESGNPTLGSPGRGHTSGMNLDNFAHDTTVRGADVEERRNPTSIRADVVPSPLIRERVRLFSQLNTDNESRPMHTFEKFDVAEQRFAREQAPNEAVTDIRNMGNIAGKGITPLDNIDTHQHFDDQLGAEAVSGNVLDQSIPAEIVTATQNVDVTQLQRDAYTQSANLHESNNILHQHGRAVGIEEHNYVHQAYGEPHTSLAGGANEGQLGMHDQTPGDDRFREPSRSPDIEDIIRQILESHGIIEFDLPEDPLDRGPSSDNSPGHRGDEFAPEQHYLPGDDIQEETGQNPHFSRGAYGTGNEYIPDNRFQGFEHGYRHDGMYRAGSGGSTCLEDVPDVALPNFDRDGVDLAWGYRTTTISDQEAYSQEHSGQEQRYTEGLAEFEEEDLLRARIEEIRGENWEFQDIHHGRNQQRAGRLQTNVESALSGRPSSLSTGTRDAVPGRFAERRDRQTPSMNREQLAPFVQTTDSLSSMTRREGTLGVYNGSNVLRSPSIEDAGEEEVPANRSHLLSGEYYEMLEMLEQELGGLIPSEELVELASRAERLRLDESQRDYVEGRGAHMNPGNAEEYDEQLGMSRGEHSRSHTGGGTTRTDSVYLPNESERDRQGIENAVGTMGVLRRLLERVLVATDRPWRGRVGEQDSQGGDSFPRQPQSNRDVHYYHSGFELPPALVQSERDQIRSGRNRISD